MLSREDTIVYAQKLSASLAKDYYEELAWRHARGDEHLPGGWDRMADDAWAAACAKNQELQEIKAWSAAMRSHLH